MERATHSIPLMCRVVRVSRSGYYAWRESEAALAVGSVRMAPSASALVVSIEIVQGHLRSSPGPCQAVQAEGGVRVANKRVARLMRKAGLEGCH
jgi:putative transposase